MIWWLLAAGLLGIYLLTRNQPKVVPPGMSVNVLSGQFVPTPGAITGGLKTPDGTAPDRDPNAAGGLTMQTRISNLLAQSGHAGDQVVVTKL